MSTQLPQSSQTVDSRHATLVAAKLLNFGIWFQVVPASGRVQFTVAGEHARLLEAFCQPAAPQADARNHVLNELQAAQHRILDTKDLVPEFGVEWDAIYLAYEATRLAWYVNRDDAVGMSEKLGLTSAQFEKTTARIKEALDANAPEA